MKHNLFKLTALVLALCLTLCACSFVDLGDVIDKGKIEKPLTDEDRILGTWKTTVECGDYFEEVMTQSVGTELAAYFPFSAVGFDLILTFDEDGNYTVTLDEDSLQVFADDILDVVLGGLRAYLEETLSGMLGDQTLDEYLNANNMDFEQLLASSGVKPETLTEDILESFDEANSKGKYRIKNGKLELDSDIHEYVFSDDKLVLEAPENTGDEMTDILFPMTLEKID